jgi:hypothetical protein
MKAFPNRTVRVDIAARFAQNRGAIHYVYTFEG